MRTTFETLALFSHEPAIRAGLLEVMEAPQRDLAGHLADVVTAVAEATDADFEEFRDMAVRLATEGMPGTSIGSMMRLNAFGGGVYRLPLPEGLDAALARAMRPRELARRLFADLRTRAGAPDALAHGSFFDAAVFRPFIALLFAYYATTDPIFYAGPR